MSTKFDKKLFAGHVTKNLLSQTAGQSGTWILLQNSFFESFLAMADPPFLFCSQTLFGESSKEVVSAMLDKLPGTLLAHNVMGSSSIIQIRILEEEDDKPSSMYMCKIDFYRDSAEKINIAFSGMKKPHEETLKVMLEAGFRFKAAKDQTAGIFFGYFTEGYMETRYKDFPLLMLDEIEENYRPEVITEARSLIELLKTEVHGLVIISGPVGTGKTYLIRAIISELTNLRESIVCTPPLAFLEEPIKMHQGLTDFGNPFVIFEDLGDIIREDAKSRYVNHFSNLANMTDGLLSILNNSVYLMTFNHSIRDIDPALVRDGRCIMQLEVLRLPAVQARSLVPEEIDMDPNKKDFSLAEVYALKNKGKSKAKAYREIGFLANKHGRRYAGDEDYLTI